MAESRWTRSMLLDLYGELLTEKQKECFDLHYNEDLSLSEIAEQLGISRQGVWDSIRRAESAMEAIEEKTGLLRRLEEERAALTELQHTLEELADHTQGRAKELVRRAMDTVGTLISRG